MEPDIKFLLKFLDAGMRTLSTRLLLIGTLILAFALFAWAMYIPDYFRIATATLFALLVFLPILGLDKKEKCNVQERTD